MNFVGKSRYLGGSVVEEVDAGDFFAGWKFMDNS